MDGNNENNIESNDGRKPVNEGRRSSDHIKKYVGMGLTALSVVVASILIFFMIYRQDAIGNFFSKLFSVLQPIIFGLVIAYILNPVMKWIESGTLRLLKKIKEKFPKNRFVAKAVGNEKKTARNFGVWVSLTLAAIVVYILLNMVIPELTNSITTMINDLPVQINNFNARVQNFIYTNEFLAKIDDKYILKAQEIMNNFMQNSVLAEIENFMSYFAIGVKGVFNFLGVVMNFIIGIIVSVYVLCSKETFTGQSKKLLYSILSRKQANAVIETLRYSDKVFGGFITGKLIDSMIIGVLCFIGMSILRLPYAVLISVIVGVTNIIPFFGPYIGAVPSILLILLVNPMQAVYFGVFILILQQIDGNIIGPKILGDSTGLSAFWVMFAILVGGGMFGFLGMIVGVPLCAVIFYIIKKATESLLVKKGLPLKSEEY
ncbi:MAG: AI-2E family transporter, partial [Oscillospiraceae bacterium]|nr:AI-2E family transporter [Oscillospiraceae bacterium]